jgi:TetR/AcrR family transcriptional regulator, regulator of autoinduction and epiphytic fitness
MRAHRFRRGRPQDAASTESILRHALAVLAKDGYHAMSLDEVVYRARSSKPTLYRRWPSKALLVADAVEHALERTPARATDARGVLRELIRMLTATPLGGAIRALVGAAATEPRLRRYLEALEASRRRLLRDAVKRQHPKWKPAAIDLEVDRLLGAVYFRYLVRGMPLRPSLAAALTGRAGPRRKPVRADAVRRRRRGRRAARAR